MRKSFIASIVYNKKNKQLSISLPKKKIRFKEPIPRRIKLRIDKVW